MKPYMNKWAQEAQVTVYGVPRAMWRKFGIRSMPTLKAYSGGKSCGDTGRSASAWKQTLDKCGGGGGGGGSPSPVPRPSPSSGGYKRLPGQYLGGYAGGDSGRRNKDQSKARCDQLGSRCGGFTCNRQESSCTVRAGRRPGRSPSGEVSYLKPGGAAAPPSGGG